MPANSTKSVKNIITQPAILIVLVMNITRPFGIASAKAPTNAASAT